MPRGGRGGRGHHHHHGRGRGWRGRHGPPPGPIFGGPIFRPPPGPRPGPYYGRMPPPGPNPVAAAVATAAVGAAVVGGAVLADDAAARRRRERELRLEEQRQIEAAQAASLREQQQRAAAQAQLNAQQQQLNEQQRQMEEQMRQLNLMKQQQAAAQAAQLKAQQAQAQAQQSAASYDYYGASGSNNNNNNSSMSPNASNSQLEGQPGAYNNNNNNNNNNQTYNYSQQQQQPQQSAPDFDYYGTTQQAQPQAQAQQQQPPAQMQSAAVPPASNPNYDYFGGGQAQQPPPSQPGSTIPAVYQQPVQAQQQQPPASNIYKPNPNAPVSASGYPVLKPKSNVNVNNNNNQPPPPSYSSHIAQQQQPPPSNPAPQRQQQQGAFIKPPADDEKSQNEGQGPSRAHGPLAIIRAGQPLPNPKPTLSGLAMYSDQMALEDAKTLRKAMKGFGTKERPIIQVSGTRNRFQRMKIISQFTNVDSVLYNDKKHRDLVKDLKSELSGNLRDVILALYMRPGEYDANLIEEACAGAGYNQALLIETLCTRTNEEIKLMQYAWDHYAKKKHKTSMKERVHKETSKLFSVGNFQTLMDSILDCRRSESKIVDAALAKKDAEELNRVITQEKKKEAKGKFVEIYSIRSWAHIRQLAADFGNISKKYTLVKAIQHTFGDSATSQAMRVITEFSTQPYDFWAKRLLIAMKGIGTNDHLLKRVVLSRCEIDLANISEVFGQRYGEGKTLAKWLKDDTGGHYKEILLYLTNTHV